MASDDNWRTHTFRQSVVSKIEEVIQRSGVQVARNSSEMENHVYMKAKTREEYMNMVAKLILHVREMSQSKQNQGAPNMQGPNQAPPGSNPQVQGSQGQPQQGPSGPGGLTPDPINALQNLASQGSRNQMMNMGPQGQMQQQGVMGPNPGMAGMQGQMGQQGPIVSQGPQAQTATNLLQTLNQRPQMNMQLSNKIGGGMGLVSTQQQMGNIGAMGSMGNPMGSQLQNQLAGGMQGQMMPTMSMPNSMSVPMSGANTMVGQMACNQVGMGGQMPPNNMQGQMGPGQMGPGQMVGNMSNNQIVGLNMLHMQQRVQNKPEVVSGMLGGSYPATRAPPPNQFLRQSPSPSAPSPSMGGPRILNGRVRKVLPEKFRDLIKDVPDEKLSAMWNQVKFAVNLYVPVKLDVMGSAMTSPMSSQGGLGPCGSVGSPSPSTPEHLADHVPPPQRAVEMSMVASPSSSLNTPVEAGEASPGGEEAAYREKVRQLSKYIEPLRRMVHQTVSVGENVMGSAMTSPMSSLGGLGPCGSVGSPSPSTPAHLAHHVPPPQRGVGMGMVASPSSSLNTPVGAGVASPGGEEAAYREKVRQLSKYIEPLRRMVHRMVSEGENVEKLTKMKNLLDILSNPNKRMPLETLIKCEVVLEKLDFKRSEGVVVPSAGKEQIFNPLLEVVNNCLQSPLANHTLKRTFGPTLDALSGPEIKNLPPPQKIPKMEEPTLDIPDVLQGEIARLDSRFKVSLEQLSCGGGAITLVAALDEPRLPHVAGVSVRVPRDYPRRPPARLAPRQRHAPGSFRARLERAMDARTARLPKSCSVGQLLDAWEMSVRQACAPGNATYSPVPALGL